MILLSRGPLALVSILAALLLAPAACISDITVQQTTLWEASLAGDSDHPLASGSAAAISHGSLTEAGITMSGLPVGTYAWLLGRGDCDAPGQTVGAESDYPALVVQGPEATSLETLASGGMIHGERYHAEVSQAETGERVACGDFTQRT